MLLEMCTMLGQCHALLEIMISMYRLTNFICSMSFTYLKTISEYSDPSILLMILRETIIFCILLITIVRNQIFKTQQKSTISEPKPSFPNLKPGNKRISNSFLKIGGIAMGHSSEPGYFSIILETAVNIPLLPIRVLVENS